VTAVPGQRVRGDNMPFRFLKSSRARILVGAGVMIATIGLLDWRITQNVFFGFLYLFPMLILGNYLRRWQLALVAAGCAFLAEWFGPGVWKPQEGIPRDLFIFAAYLGAGFFAYESKKNRDLTLLHVQEIEQEVKLRRDAEEQLRVLIESSPAAILTLDSEGKILLANQAAHRLLGFEAESLGGVSVGNFLPPLANVPVADESTPSFRTGMQCYGRRRDGEVFLADVWFSTYRTRLGPRLAAMVVDSSEDLRDRKEFSLHQLLAGSRLVVGAVSHEIRNVCGAIAVVYANLSRNDALIQNEDFRALGNLVEGLSRVAKLELRQSARVQEITGLDLHSVFNELRIVVEAPLSQSGIMVHWNVPDVLPLVLADRENLLQVFLNLIKNSERAMELQERKELTISTSLEDERVLIRVRDTGPGIASPEHLFRPFQSGAQATGLGLYLSRAFVKAFKGDLRYEPEPSGCCFTLELKPLPVQENEPETAASNGQDQDPAGRRSHSISRGPESASAKRA
jgi:two-component system, LuxR family, sensor kinase FixL